MKTRFLTFTLILAATTLSAQSTAFTYQGRLDDNAGPASGIYDVRFTIYDALANGSAVSGIITNTPTLVSNGLFSVALDFGANSFTGGDRWLEIGVRTNGGGTFDTLTPRQRLTSTPYAITAGNVTGTLTSSNLGGAYSNAVTFNNSSNQFTGTFAGSGGALSNVNAAALGGVAPSNYWRLGGNFISTFPLQLGTIDSLPMTVIAGNRRALRLEPASRTVFLSSTISPNLIGGSEANVVSNGVLGATIAGGGLLSGAGGFFFPFPNVVSDDHGSIGGGFNNVVGNTNSNPGDASAANVGGGEANRAHADHATVGGGLNNVIEFNSAASAIGGGRNNSIEADSIAALISGGEANGIRAGASGARIGGGTGNTIETGANSAGISGGAGNRIQASIESTIGGGSGNTIEANAPSSTIGGGQQNRIQNSARGATVGGGEANIAAGNYATVPGGQGNVALGQFSFAAGHLAHAIPDGAFVWSDNSGSAVNATAPNQFLIRASGGVGIGTENPISALHVVGTVTADAFVGSGAGLYSLSAPNLTGTIADIRLSANVALRSGGNTFNGGQTFNGQIRLDATDGFSQSSAGNFYIDAPFIIGGRVTVLAGGNVGIGTNAPQQKLHVVGGAMFTSGSGLANQTVSWTPGNGSWSFTSDRNTKERFNPVDAQSVLQKVSRLSIAEWSYIGYEQRHIGPTAQDFHEQFPLNENNKTLNDVDLHGVALAAIQGLNQKLEEQLKQKEDRLTALEQQISELKQLVVKFSGTKD